MEFKHYSDQLTAPKSETIQAADTHSFAEKGEYLATVDPYLVESVHRSTYRQVEQTSYALNAMSGIRQRALATFLLVLTFPLFSLSH